MARRRRRKFRVGVPLCQRTLRGFRRPARRGTAVRAACSRWLHRCCGRLRPYCTPSWRHSRVQQRLGRTAPRYYIIRGPGKVHGGAGGGGSGGRNEGAAVGDSPPFVPVSQAGYTVHGRGRRRLLFRPGHCSRRKAPYTAKYINLHPSYRRPGVQPSPSLSEIILDFGTCEVMNNMQYVICNGAMTALRWASSTQTRRSSSARRRSPTFSLSLREWLRHRG